MVTDEARAPLRDAVAFSGYTAGKTHNFYHYPARFSPEFARAVIARFSRPGDIVLDPFMGGGTAIVEGLALGRRMIGVDINTLARFLAEVRTAPRAGVRGKVRVRTLGQLPRVVAPTA